jgi:uncharacterized protein YqeY
MALADQLQRDLTSAMKARDAETVATLRMVVAAIKNARVAAGGSGEVDDAEVVELIGREAKKRREAEEAFRAAGRAELADREAGELRILRRYLPEALGDDELRAIVDQAVADTGATGPGDLGRVMSAVMPRVKGRADGRAVNAMVRECLGG